MEEASWAVSNDKIQKGDVLVIRYEGPRVVLGCGRCT